MPLPQEQIQDDAIKAAPPLLSTHPTNTLCPTSGHKLDSLLHKTLHPSHECHLHHHIDHHDSRDAESNNNFAGTNPRPLYDSTGQAVNNFPGTNPRPASRDGGNNNFPGLSPHSFANNFPGTNPRPWSERHQSSEASSCVPSDTESEVVVGSGARPVVKRRWRSHASEAVEKEEEDGNNFPGMNPVAKPDKKKSVWSFRDFEEGNNFPGTNPNSKW